MTRCIAIKSNGKQCGQDAYLDLRRCEFHSGRVAMENAATRKGLKMMFGDKMDIHPADALIQLVQCKAGEVAYWNSKIRELQELGLEVVEEGVVRTVDGPMGETVTSETRPHPWYEMLRVAERDLANYCTVALRAGVEERQVRIAESLGGQILEVVNQVLERLQLTPSQMSIAGDVVPTVLRAIGSGATVERSA